MPIASEYVDVEAARKARGLRLVLTRDVPGPWGESAKAIFGMKGLRFAAVAQEGGGENRELREWTGQSAAPVAIYENELPLSDSIDILFLAERLQPEPRLVPTDIDARATMFGIAREIIGRDGIGWNRRIMMLAPMLERAAAELEREAERRLTWFAALLQPALIVLMGAIVLVLVLAVMLPIVSMNQLIR